MSEIGKKQICETCPTYLQDMLFSCRKSLEPLSQIATVVYSLLSTSQWSLITTDITDMWHFASQRFKVLELRLLNLAKSSVDIWGLFRIIFSIQSSSSLSWGTLWGTSWGTPWVTSWVTPWVPSWVPFWISLWVSFWATPFVDLIIFGAIRCAKMARRVVKP